MQSLIFRRRPCLQGSLRECDLYLQTDEVAGIAVYLYKNKQKLRIFNDHRGGL